MASALAVALAACPSSGDKPSVATTVVPTSEFEATTTPTPTTPNPVTTLPKALRVGAITFHVPETWGLDGGPPVAYVGILAGGRGDVALRVEAFFERPIDSLEPTECLGAPPSVPIQVDLIESGFRPVGDRTADFRFWKSTCPGGDGGNPEEHRAWVLPVSKIAIFEQRHEPEVVDVVTTADVRP